MRLAVCDTGSKPFLSFEHFEATGGPVFKMEGWSVIRDCYRRLSNECLSRQPTMGPSMRAVRDALETLAAAVPSPFALHADGVGSAAHEDEDDISYPVAQGTPEADDDEAEDDLDCVMLTPSNTTAPLRKNVDRVVRLSRQAPDALEVINVDEDSVPNWWVVVISPIHCDTTIVITHS